MCSAVARFAGLKSSIFMRNSLNSFESFSVMLYFSVKTRSHGQNLRERM